MVAFAHACCHFRKNVWKVLSWEGRRMTEGSVKPNDISLSTSLLFSVSNAEGVRRDQALCREHISTGDIFLKVYSYLIDLTCMSV